MISISLIHQVLAYLFAAVAVVGVALAGVIRFTGQQVGFGLFSWMSIAGVSLLFAIYFFAGGILLRDKKIRIPFAESLKKRQKKETLSSLLKTRVFSISEENKGLSCPFKSTICQNGYCEECQIYSDWRELGEELIICALCVKATSIKPSQNQPVSYAICPECWQKFFTHKGAIGSRLINKRE